MAVISHILIMKIGSLYWAFVKIAKHQIYHIDC